MQSFALRDIPPPDGRPYRMGGTSSGVVPGGGRYLVDDRSLSPSAASVVGVTDWREEAMSALSAARRERLRHGVEENKLNDFRRQSEPYLNRVGLTGAGSSSHRGADRSGKLIGLQKLYNGIFYTFQFREEILKSCNLNEKMQVCFEILEIFFLRNTIILDAIFGNFGKRWRDFQPAILLIVQC